MKDEKKEETNVPQNETKVDETKEAKQPAEEKKVLPAWRQVILETDGGSIRLAKDETAGILELSAILSSVLNSIQSQSKK